MIGSSRLLQQPFRALLRNGRLYYTTMLSVVAFNLEFHETNKKLKIKIHVDTEPAAHFNIK